MSLRLNHIRLSFPNVFRPTAFDPNAEKKYSATLILDEGDPQVDTIKEEIEKKLKEKWPSDRPSNIRLALRDGSEKDMDGFGPGKWFFNASNKARPGVYDRNRSPLTEEDGKIVPGCYVNAIVDFWVQSNSYGKRVNATLKGIQYDAEGESFGGGGRVAGADDFDDLGADDFLN